MIDFVVLQRLSDWMTNAKKHLLAPRARTQEQMNHWFQGTYYNLGERYTDLTKILFLVFVYSPIYPAAFFFGSAILFVQYYVRINDIFTEFFYVFVSILTYLPFQNSKH
jgi:hypothetical protein